MLREKNIWGWSAQAEKHNRCYFKVIKLESVCKTHQEHVPKIVKVAEEFLCRDFSWVKDKVLSQVWILLLHVLMQHIQLLILLSSTTDKTVQTGR